MMERNIRYWQRYNVPKRNVEKEVKKHGNQINKSSKCYGISTTT